MKVIAYSNDALRTLRKMSANLRELIVSKITTYAENPAALANNLEPLKGRPGVVRLRIGDWRVIMTDDGKVIAVIKIATRGSVYE